MGGFALGLNPIEFVHVALEGAVDAALIESEESDLFGVVEEGLGLGQRRAGFCGGVFERSFRNDGILRLA